MVLKTLVRFLVLLVLRFTFLPDSEFVGKNCIVRGVTGVHTCKNSKQNVALTNDMPAIRQVSVSDDTVEPELIHK